MSETTAAPARPRTDDLNAWKAYWQAQGMPWRTEPEIDEERQHFLVKRRAIQPDAESGSFPFRDIKLVRADVEWLLATHESGGMRGPVDWSDQRQRERPGLDLRGADLRQASLAGLPLARLRCGYDLEVVSPPVAAHPDLELPDLYNIPNGMVFGLAHLENADLRGCHPEGASFGGAHLGGAALDGASLESAFLTAANVFGPNLTFSLDEYTSMAMNGANLLNARMQGANLQGSACVGVHLEGADLRVAHLRGAVLVGAHLEDADLRMASFGETTLLNGATLGSEHDGVSRLADVNWGGANLALVRWVQSRQVMRIARQGMRSERTVRTNRALRANRQLAIELRNQGLNDQADRFAYAAQVLQRRVHWFQGKGLRYLGSLFLDLISGYGYRPMRSLIAYVLVILGFAAAYYALGGANGYSAQSLTWNEAIVISMTAFHGRGFFPMGFQPGDMQAAVAAVEAFIGLLIEIVLIATFTQRFFAR